MESKRAYMKMSINMFGVFFFDSISDSAVVFEPGDKNFISHSSAIETRDRMESTAAVVHKGIKFQSFGKSKTPGVDYCTCFLDIFAGFSQHRFLFVSASRPCHVRK